MINGMIKGLVAIMLVAAGFTGLCYMGAVYAKPTDKGCSITQEELDAEYTALGTYEIQVEELCE